MHYSNMFHQNDFVFLTFSTFIDKYCKIQEVLTSYVKSQNSVPISEYCKFFTLYNKL